MIIVVWIIIILGAGMMMFVDNAQDKEKAKSKLWVMAIVISIIVGAFNEGFGIILLLLFLCGYFLLWLYSKK